jgi:hypothetical protein
LTSQDQQEAEPTAQQQQVSDELNALIPATLPANGPEPESGSAIRGNNNDVASEDQQETEPTVQQQQASDVFNAHSRMLSPLLCLETSPN